MRVGWLIAQQDAVPAEDSWLLPAERAVAAALRVAKRRRDWRLGRWAAKQAVSTMADLDARDVEIRAAPDGVPEAWHNQAALPLSISLSHCADTALCVAAMPGVPLGCDIELVEPRHPAFAAEWFDETEQALLRRLDDARARDLLATVLWSAKESALKLRRRGLRDDPRSVAVRLGTADTHQEWHPLRLDDAYAWWRPHTAMVLTVACAVDSPPEPLR